MQLLNEAEDAYRLGDFNGAAARYIRIAEREPGDPVACYRAGHISGRAGMTVAAETWLKRATKLKPGFSDALADLGNLMSLSGRDQLAQQYYEQALQSEPGHMPTIYNLAVCHAKAARYEIAEALLLQAVEVRPPHLGSYAELVRVLVRNSKVPAALALAQTALHMFPGQAEVHAVRGYVLLKNFEPAAAASALRLAIEIDKQSAETWMNLGIALQDLGDVPGAIAAYDSAIELDGSRYDAHFHRGLACLLVGNWRQGWEDYEYRLRGADHPVRSAVAPRLTSEDVRGKRVLVTSEQGLGDQIMFASCLPDMVAEGALITLECDPRLVPVMCRSFPMISVVSSNDVESSLRVRHDFEIPIGSLPLRFRPDSAAFLQHTGYLKCDVVRRGQLMARGEAQSGARALRVGIAWRGGTVKSRGVLRSFALERLGNWWQIPNVRFVSLQHDATEQERAYLVTNGADVFEDVLDSIDETLALMSSLDLVVTVCCSIVHFAGALGIPAWVLAPSVPEWRYGLKSEGMAWYPTVRVWRQEMHGNWAGVIARVEMGLRERSATIIAGEDSDPRSGLSLGDMQTEV